MNLRKGLIPLVDISYLRGRVDVHSLLDDLGIDFDHQQGQWLMCHCPDWLGLHSNGDASASFGLNPESLAVNCFVCGKIDLIDLIKSCGVAKTDPEALAFIEQHSDLNPRGSSNLLERVNEIIHPKVDNDVMPEYDPGVLKPFRKLHPYLWERGLTREVAIEMQVGYDEDHDAILIPHFFKRKLTGWQLRHLGECNVCLDPPKYKSTKNLPKIHTLYGYDRLLKTLTTEENYVIVVESPMSCLKLLSLGLKNVVATFGSWSSEQGALLLPIKTLYFWPDNDGAGFINTEHCIESNQKFNSIKVVPVLPSAKGDPGDLNSLEEAREYLDAAYPSSLFPLISKGKLATISDR